MSVSPLILDASAIKWIDTTTKEPEGILHLKEQPCDQCSQMCVNVATEGHFCLDCVNKFKFCDHCTDHHPDQHQWTVRVNHFEHLLCKDCNQWKGMTNTLLVSQESAHKVIFCTRCKLWKADNVLACGTLLCNECYVHEATDLIAQQDTVIKQLQQKMKGLREIAKQVVQDNTYLRQKNKELRQRKNKSIFDELAITEFKQSEHGGFSEKYEPAILPTNNAS